MTRGIVAVILAIVADHAIRRRGQPRHQAQQTGLAATVAPGQQQSAAARDCKIQSREDQAVAADTGQVFSRKRIGHSGRKVMFRLERRYSKAEG
jgi:hypothetical protein